MQPPTCRSRCLIKLAHWQCNPCGSRRLTTRRAALLLLLVALCSPRGTHWMHPRAAAEAAPTRIRWDCPCPSTPCVTVARSGRPAAGGRAQCVVVACPPATALRPPPARTCADPSDLVWSPTLFSDASVFRSFCCCTACRRVLRAVATSPSHTCCHIKYHASSLLFTIDSQHTQSPTTTKAHSPHTLARTTTA